VLVSADLVGVLAFVLAIVFATIQRWSEIWYLTGIP
jgi:hypothetical protein